MVSPYWRIAVISRARKWWPARPPASDRSSPKPLTSGAKADGRFGKQDFIYQPETDTYRCPAGEQLIWRFTTVENGLKLSRYWSSNCGTCAMKAKCTPSKQRRITRWEHEAVIEVMQRRLDEMPNAMRVRRSIVES